MKPRDAPEPIKAALRALVTGTPRKAAAHAVTLKNAGSVEPANKHVDLFLKTLLEGKPGKRRRLWYQSFVQPDYLPAKIVTPYQAFQYWSQGSPPDDVAQITELWSDLLQGIGLPPILVFDKARADSWIGVHCPELLGVFRSAYDYAAEADVFRVAYASRQDCIWIDADLYPKNRTVGLLQRHLERHDLVLYFRWSSPWISNAFFASKASCPFFRSFAETMSDYRYSVDDPGQEEIMKAFGPTRYNSRLAALFRDEQSELIRPNGMCFVAEERRYSVSFVNEHVFAFMSPPKGLHYKKTRDYWKNRFVQQG